MSVYLPAAFKEDRPELLYALMRARPLITLIAQTDGGFCANHLPVELVMEKPIDNRTDAAAVCVLRGHVARANPLWKDCSLGSEALAIFQGPDTYVSPSLYAAKAETGEVVPTWDYAVVHARGSLRFSEDAEWLRALVGRLTNGHEAARPAPWKVEDAPPAYIDKMLQAIVGFELTVTSLLGKWKVSQNRSAADRQGVIAGLQAATDADAREIASMLSALSG